jgi:lipopolysaccharide transport system permease protein
MNPPDAAGAAAVEPTLSIRPPRRWGDLRLRELWEYHELIYFLTKREMQIRYKQSLFGVSWAVLQPLAIAFLFALIFGSHVVKLPSDNLPYVIFALAALVPWLFTAQAVNQSALGLVADQALLSKVYFPRLAIPLAKAGALLLDLMIGMVVLVVFTLIYGIQIDATALLVPAFLALGVVATFGVGTLLSAINVKYRDVTVATPVIIQIWFFATPVIYPGSAVTGNAVYAYALNPMVSVVNGVRWALLGADAPSLLAVGISVASALTIALVAVVYFRRTEQFFADVI